MITRWMCERDRNCKQRKKKKRVGFADVVGGVYIAVKETSVAPRGGE